MFLSIVLGYIVYINKDVMFKKRKIQELNVANMQMIALAH